MALDPTILKEPVTRDDILDQEEMIDSIAETQRAFVERVRFQYRQESWISTELLEIYNLLVAAGTRLSSLRAMQNVFPE
jgi:hypothetical protein